MLLLKHNKFLVRMENELFFVIDIQVSVCLKKYQFTHEHLQNIISFNFLYLQKMICPKL